MRKLQIKQLYTQRELSECTIHLINESTRGKDKKKYAIVYKFSLKNQIRNKAVCVPIKIFQPKKKKKYEAPKHRTFNHLLFYKRVRRWVPKDKKKKKKINPKIVFINTNKF